MTHGTIAGMLLSDLILGRPNPYYELYDPGRLKLMTTGAKLITQNIHIAETLIRGRLSRPEKLTPLDVGEAKVAEIDDREAAVYKDDRGEIHALSPVCTHMGCIVSWNNAERSWDCPCHGSRFNFDGKILHCPTVKKLEKRQI
ncbi:Rieske Fe-S protein [Candidatus Methanoperedens nitroreducens]|uniref:Rieske Fe-S protein n=1 Tax=Candidatus Methanoperedens nitratireducens TaxID=1392998 RepID=A0A062V6J8_9EURY|nr:Rieske 2Fe-2S domain-containing protein [Candidatus Methanoperedens nitroreducens]KCZ71005.1 Rieske Fe-S protein [Candidatus Methanoperedens nitroreducens]MDJ1421625.1 Rieske 2Fe-2S domain-containing protein [Candidatus Methanoperedens sp.]